MRAAPRLAAAARPLAALAAVAAGLAATAGATGCGSAEPDELPPPAAPAAPAAARPLAEPPAGRTVRIAPPGADLGDAVAAGGRIAVAQARPPRLLVLDRRGRVEARIPLPGPPGVLAVDEDTGDVLVPAGRRLLRIDAASGEQEADNPLPGGAGAAAALPGGSAAVVLPRQDRLVLGPGATVPTAPAPVAVVPAADGRRLVVLAAQAREVELRDARTGRLLDTADAGLGPARMALRGRWLWVTDLRGNALLIYRVLEDRIEFARRAHLPGAPFAITVDPDRYRLRVALTASGSVAELPAHGRPRVLETLPALRAPRGVAVLAGADGPLAVTGADGLLQLAPLPAPG